MLEWIFMYATKECIEPCVLSHHSIIQEAKGEQGKSNVQNKSMYIFWLLKSKWVHGKREERVTV